MSVHLRRRDFLRGRPDEVPDLDSVAEQIAAKLDQLTLTKVFVATDAPQEGKIVDLGHNLLTFFQ